MSFLSVLLVLVIVFSLTDTAALKIAGRLRLYRYNADAAPPLLDYLKQQLSQGILHPKIY
jgi:hypothetical protein